jgi:hypothetical protein
MPTSTAGRVEQVFALTTAAAATYSDPSGAFAPLPSTMLAVDLKFNSLLTITFSARGTVQPSMGTVPIVFIKCEIDGNPCEPDSGSVEFLYPQFCCDTRSFTWVVDRAASGRHTIAILWGMGNPTSAVITSRTLLVEASRL